MAVRMATLTACHHSAQKKPAATHAATQTTVTCGEQARVTEYLTPEPAETCRFLPVIEYLTPATVVNYAAPVSVPEYVAPAPAIAHTAPSPVSEHAGLCTYCHSCNTAPVIEYVMFAPAATFAAPVAVIEYVAPHLMQRQRQRLNAWCPHLPSPILRLLL